MGLHLRPRPSRLDRDRDAEERVVHLRVPEERASKETIPTKSRLARERLRYTKAAVLGKGAPAGQRGVEGEPERDPRGGTAFPAVVRDHEGERADERGRGLEEDGAFAERFAHKPELGGFQIADSAVDQLRRAAARAGSEIARLEHEHRQTAKRSIARHGRTVNPTTHHQNVEDREYPPWTRDAARRAARV